MDVLGKLEDAKLVFCCAGQGFLKAQVVNSLPGVPLPPVRGECSGEVGGVTSWLSALGLWGPHSENFTALHRTVQMHFLKTVIRIGPTSSVVTNAPQISMVLTIEDNFLLSVGLSGTQDFDDSGYFDCMAP